LKRKKIHIDELFRNGLKSLSLFVSNKDLEAIDDKKNIYNTSPDQTKDSVFTDFELEVNESDWLATKAKLDIEKSAMAQDNIFASGLSEMELDVPPGDWAKTFDKYKQKKKRRVLFTWLGTGIVVLILSLIGISNLLTSAIKQDQIALNEKSSSKNSLSTNSEINDKPESKDNAKSISPDEKELDSDLSNENPETNQKIKVNTDEVKASIANTKDSRLENNVKSNSDLSNLSKVESSRTGDGKEEVPQAIENQVQPNSSKLDDMSSFDATKKEQVLRADVAEDPNVNKENASSEHLGNISSPLENNIRLGEAVVDTPKVSNDLNPKPNPVIPKFNLYAGIVNQVSITHRMLDKKNPELYNSVRNNGEKPFIQNSFGFEFGVQKKGLQISGGIQSTSQKWSTSYNYSYAVFDSLPVWNPGRTQIIGYFLVRGRDTSINEQNEIKISKVQFPVEVSGVFRLNDNLKLIAGGGLLFSLHTASSGTKILNPINNQLYAYSVLEEKERSFNVLPSLNVGIQKNLGKHFLFQSNISGNMALQSRFKNSFGAKDYPYSVGINFKLLYILK
jgi:hypothetical protein